VNIRERREELGISQGELAKKCGIAQSTLCDIEQGRSNPSISVAVKLANALDIKDIKFFKKGE
jgi:putative transcriptional regulator